MSSKRVPLNTRYKYSIPVHPVELPSLVPHNPISWARFLYTYLSSTNTVNTTIVQSIDGLFFVEDQDHIKSLWAEGFFGKGVFSRSEASWFDRTQKRLGIGEFKNLTVEEITALRRDERKKFKKERSKLESKQAELKKKGIVDPFIEDRLALKNLRDKDITINLERETYIRDEDDALICDGELVNIEKLQLQPQEVFFMKFALNSVNVLQNESELSTVALFNQLSSKKADDPFILNYIAYHHYRSLGWCVRSGIKFGSDYLLYKRGPPFHHAEFAILILPNYKDEDKNKEASKQFDWLSGVSRVVGGVRKRLILVFVDVPTQEEFDAKVDNLPELFRSYNINEVIYSRWVANKNRD
jgi:tRNA-splicing endonuclease subunit Sen2